MHSNMSQAPSLEAAMRALEQATAGLLATLDTLAEAGHDEIAETIVGLRRVVDRCESAYLRCVRQVDASGSWGVDGAVSTTAWLRWRARLTGPAAAAAVRTARELDLRLSSVARALAEGEISVEAARVVATGVHGTSDADTAALEPIALAAARQVAPDGVAAAMRRYRYCLDPDEGAEAALRRSERQGLSWARTYDGMIAVRALLDEVTGAAVITAVGAKSAPTAGDHRTPAQRRAQALGEICTEALDSGRLPQTALVRPHVVLTVDLATLQRQPGHADAELAHSGPVCPDTARRVACEADVTVVAVDRGQPVTLGRERRFFTAAQKRAILARDGLTCHWPGCDRPADWTHAHHEHHWADGGATDVANGRLYCPRHHPLLHEGGWSVHPAGAGRFFARHRTGREIWPEGPREARPPPG
ncbi:MAG: DUF222 domain-containing protein [Actinomycetes bacterium]